MLELTPLRKDEVIVFFKTAIATSHPNQPSYTAVPQFLPRNALNYEKPNDSLVEHSPEILPTILRTNFVTCC
jgi:hypothetical protein